jgi:F-type H+-transporting ATPase subunit delta
MSISNYAKALFQIAKEENKIDIISYQFENFYELIQKNENWIKLMDSPMVLYREKLRMIDALKYDASFLSFLKIIAKKNNVHFYKEIYDEWLRLSRIYQKIAHITIHSAKELSSDYKEKLIKSLEPRFINQTISLNVKVKPDLLGGIRIIYQGQSLDRSISREIEELYTTI